MIKHVTYADENMSISAVKCSESALYHGCDVSNYSIKFDDKFKKFNSEILCHKRGAGYWLFKPYIILDSLLELQENDILVYTDAGLLFENNINHVIHGMDQDIMVFDNRWKHGDWCKMDVIVKMGCNKPEFIEHTQLQASCIILKCTRFSKNFIKEWLCWCMMPGMIDDSPSKLQNIEKFREHRHDQAILTNLAFIHGLKFHWWPVQYCLRNKHEYSDNYNLTFFHHRKRNNEW